MFDQLMGAQGGLAVLGIFSAAAIIAALFWLVVKRRRSPAERERRRRLGVHRKGRITNGMVIDFRVREATLGQAEEHLIDYQYVIRGIDYSTVQEVSGIAEIVRADPAGLIGAASVKYLPDNPYNSIVVCEEWSGLRGTAEEGQAEASAAG